MIVWPAGGGWPRTLVLEGIEAIVFRTIGDRPSPWEGLLPAELLRLPEELARVDALLDDPAFFAPFAPYFHPVLGRPSTPAESYLRQFLDIGAGIPAAGKTHEVAQAVAPDTRVVYVDNRPMFPVVAGVVPGGARGGCAEMGGRGPCVP